MNVSYALLICRVSAHALSTFSKAAADGEGWREGWWDIRVDTACEGLRREGEGERERCGAGRGEEKKIT